MTTCLRPHHDFDDFMTDDLTTSTTSRLVIDLETHFCTINPVSRTITSCEVVKVVTEVVESRSRESREVVES